MLKVVNKSLYGSKFEQAWPRRHRARSEFSLVCDLTQKSPIIPASLSHLSQESMDKAVQPIIYMIIHIHTHICIHTCMYMCA